MHGGMIEQEVKNLKAIKKCAHEWEGPIELIQINQGGATYYGVNCKHCTLGKHFPSKQEAEQEITE